MAPESLSPMNRPVRVASTVAALRCLHASTTFVVLSLLSNLRLALEPRHLNTVQLDHSRHNAAAEVLSGVSNQLVDCFAVANGHRATVGHVVVDVLSIIAQRSEDGGMDVGGRDRTHKGIGTGPVGFADDLTASDSAAGEYHRITLWPVIPTGVFVDDRSSPKITHPDDESFIQQAAFRQIIQQGHVGFFHGRDESILHLAEVVFVRVPCDARAVNRRDKATARFDQSTRQQMRLPPAVSSVTVPNTVGFPGRDQRLHLRYLN